MKKVAALLALALASVALAACGGGGSSESTSTETSTGGEAAAGGAAAGAEGGGGAEGSSLVKIEAVEGSGLEYAEKEVTAKPGVVAIEFTNPQSLSHDVSVEDSSGKTLGKTELVAEGSTEATIGKLEPGTYTFYCSVPGHREAGMEGKLIVK
jgi:plastocyanin